MEHEELKALHLDARNEVIRLTQENKEIRDSLMGRWISVEDRLPEEKAYYLVCCIYARGADFDDQMMSVSYWDGRFHYASDYFVESAITHWMSLPNPTKAVHSARIKRIT